jgi:hypothetical protein
MSSREGQGRQHRHPLVTHDTMSTSCAALGIDLTDRLGMDVHQLMRERVSLTR